ncbi:hypothetical protein WMY93_017712 [Mugilogobius chulae]|uniref:C2H2-type domain-containing protein n=1 Tax=Mugilogobius chulae TaxID=88201 RepID=A0AAW0NTR2_9GOBI
MPTQSLLPFVESSDGLTQEVLISNSANIPGPGSSMTPHSSCLDKAMLTTSIPLISCMFCDQTFTHQEDLGPHVLAQHPTTFPEPTVLRVEAEFRIPVSQYALELENHMRKHKDYFYYCCNICGRRFREPWFLKTHMKIHTKSAGRSKAAQEIDFPITINGVPLAAHCKIHNREVEFHDKDGENLTGDEDVPKETFIQSLKLRPSQGNTTLEPVRTSKWIAQLDPFNTYQAWQLATKGKIAVGLNNIKDLSQDASTDNEESTSDKEELGHGFVEDKNSKDRSAPPAITAPPLPQRRSLIQKDKNKERPTTCDECNKTFRTYHQLVLHSRIHKRDRPGEESPTAGLEKLGRSGAVDQEDEEGLEEAPLADILASGEDCFDRAKGRSKECSYCGKTFRSSYYLTVHLRTHTGEKPFKCAYCDYAAAQKTSLKYHLDRRHKDKPYMELPSRPASASSSSVSSLPSPSDLKLDQDSENSSSPTKMWTKMPKSDSKPSKHLLNNNIELAKLMSKCTEDLPMPVNLKIEKREIKDEISYDAPLNLSLKVSLSIPTESRKASIPSACHQCAFKTIYPEVLMIHRKLAHKEKSDITRRTAISRQKRHTGCPPALDGKDVAPLPTIVRSHPRRTKSPTPLSSKPQEKPSANKATLAPKQSPSRENIESQKPRQNAEQKDSRFTEVMRTHNSGGKYLPEMPTDRIGIGERSYSVRNGVVWPTDSARMCLSSRFGNLPHMDLGEPSNKRLKYNAMPQARDSDAAEKPSFRNVSMTEMPNRSARLSLPGSHTSSSSSVSDALGPVKSSSVTPGGALDGLGQIKSSSMTLGGALDGLGQMKIDGLGQMKSSSVTLGGALDSEWGTMNLLRSCTLSDLASLYHSSPGNPPRAGGRTVLYQHLPTLPTLPRRDSTGAFPSQRYGTADKSA